MKEESAEDGKLISLEGKGGRWRAGRSRTPGKNVEFGLRGWEGPAEEGSAAR